MNEERKIYGQVDLTLDQLASLSSETPPLYIGVVGTQESTGYEYRFGFHFDHPKGQYINISTEERRTFLTKGTEQQTQDALVALAQIVRQKSGGYFGIHPFYGLVWGTKLTPVAPGFLTDLESPDEDLSVFIYLTNAGDKFDKNLTREAMQIGTVIEVPGPKAERFLNYLRKPKANPNQEGRGTAIVNGLREKWDAEFRKYHQGTIATSPIGLSPNNIAELLKDLASRTSLVDLKVTRLTQ